MKELDKETIDAAMQAARTRLNQQLDKWGFPKNQRRFRDHITGGPLQVLAARLDLARQHHEDPQIQDYIASDTRNVDMSFLKPDVSRRISEVYEAYYPNDKRMDAGLRSVEGCPYQSSSIMEGDIRKALNRIAARAVYRSLERGRETGLS